ncbi:Invasin CotH7 [Mucor velutinosus]|uniref:Invasin CotH7 n=1 Tax=Mucor velutinosus TaxID=708070 RepID=A0AAN7HRG0_9FUNG|nr:Invasin CotH7 [Mucor velutinosus]
MDQQSRSSSVPLIHLEDDDDANLQDDLISATRLPRSSFSLSSIQPVISRPTSPQMPLLWHNSTEQVPLNDTDTTSSSSNSSCDLDDSEYDMNTDNEDDDDTISASSDDETSIAIPGRKTLMASKIHQLNASVMDLSSDILYEDIWIDSPVFHDYLSSLETWLYHYLTWLEKVEQCRQLEIAEECSNLNWPNGTRPLDEDEIWDNEDIRSVLPFLRKHGSKIKETLTHFEGTVTASRLKHVQLSNSYCAAQKLKTSQANNKSLDEISTSLYVAKRSLCKVLLEYIYALNNLIRSTRNLVNDKLRPLFEGLQSDKHRNLKTLEELVLISTDFVYDVNSKKSTSNTSFTSSNNSSEDARPVSPSPVSRSSFEDYHELNNERLSYYIQEKLASYYTCLKNSLKPPPNENLTRARPSSPTLLIPFTFLNKPRVVTTVVVTNLRTASVYASETDKRDFVIQIASQGTSNIMSLQAETAIDFSTWLQALRSWNPQQVKTSSGNTRKISQHTPSSAASANKRVAHPRYSSTGTAGSSNRTFLTKKSSFSAGQTLQMDLPYSKKGNSIDILSPSNHRTSPTNFVNNGENNNGELLFGYPIPVTECPINCCSTTGTVSQAKLQMTGLFRIHKLCINKLSCTSHHTGTLCVLHVSLFQDGMLHLQTEKDDNSFFHRPIQLSTLAPQDIYPFSDSIDHMRYCIVIRPLPSETYHLMTCSKVQRDAWLVHLKNCTNNAMMSIPNSVSTCRNIFSLTVRIAEARKFQVSHKDSIHSELYCDIVIDNEIRGLTGSLKKTSTLFWREEFLFSDISRMRHGVTITIYSRSSKNDRETVYGTVFLPVSQIDPSNAIHEEWYEVRKESRNRAFASLTSLGSSHGSMGQLRVGLLLEEHQVFSLDVYQPLMDVLTEFRHDIIYDMARKTSDVQGLAKNLLRIYEGMGLTLTWIKSLIDYEVSSLSSDDVNILFRGNSFFTKVIDNYMKMSGMEFLEEALQFTIQKICKFSLHIEVESSRLSNSTTENTMANCSELFSHVRSIWSGIQRAKTKCPIELRRIFGHLQSAIVKKFDLGKETLDRHHQVARYTCVSGFIFLRWICPAIISPKQFGLVQDHPDTKTCRTLTLIAKCLMTLASHSTIEQNAKEPWMVRLNEFVQNNTHHFMNFINFVSVDDDDLVDKNEGILLLRHKQEEIIAPYFIDLALELSQFTTWCSQECNVINTITRTCKSIVGLQRNPSRRTHQQLKEATSAVVHAATTHVIHAEEIMLQQQRRKTRPQPWQYGDDYLAANAGSGGNKDEVLNIAVRSSSATE